MGRYIEGDFLPAEAMFERLIGHQFAVTTHVENHTFGKHTGRQIKLKHFPVEILACEGFLIFDELKFKDWMVELAEITKNILAQLLVSGMQV